MRERLPSLHTLLSYKWCFDELIDVVIVRPILWSRQSAETVLKRPPVGGVITGGSTGIVRAGSAAVRRAQTGCCASYAAAMILGLAAVALSFLTSST